MPKSRCLVPCLLIIGALGMNVNAQSLTEVEAIFENTPAPERGSKGPARLRDAVTARVDTSLPRTPPQITQRIEALINQGRPAEALEAINKRLAQREARAEIGVDVQ